MAKEVTKNYIIWTLVLAVFSTLLAIGGLVCLICSINPFTVGLLIAGVLMLVVGGFFSGLMWIAFSTSLKTYKRKTDPDSFKTPD